MSPRSSSRPGCRAVLAGAAMALMLLAPVTARAADTDVVTIPDANLKARLNARIGSGRAATQDITVGEAAGLSSTYSLTGPFADLTGLEAFVNVRGLTIAGISASQSSTYTSLAPLAGLTKLTSLNLQSGRARSVRPLAGLTNLTTLTVRGQGVTNPAPLGSLTNLTSLTLTDNAISDASRLPQLPNVTTLVLTRNRIVNPAPLVGKVDHAKIRTLGLAGNRITDASSLAALGDSRLIDYTSSGEGLDVSRNRITDLTPFDSWSRLPPQENLGSQQLYVGSYQPGGVVLPALETERGGHRSAEGRAELGGDLRLRDRAGHADGPERRERRSDVARPRPLGPADTLDRELLRPAGRPV